MKIISFFSNISVTLCTERGNMETCKKCTGILDTSSHIMDGWVSKNTPEDKDWQINLQSFAFYKQRTFV